MYVNIYIYSKCEGLTHAFKDPEATAASSQAFLSSSDSTLSVQTSQNAGGQTLMSSMTDQKTQLMINYSVKYGS